jgi:hypothetical protein
MPGVCLLMTAHPGTLNTTRTLAGLAEGLGCSYILMASLGGHCLLMLRSFGEVPDVAEPRHHCCFDVAHLVAAAEQTPRWSVSSLDGGQQGAPSGG